jgi:uncharacterized circularly permuted ATP-grasp superfamily protein/uncharacterized alpha-E superfamily protein
MSSQSQSSLSQTGDGLQPFGLSGQENQSSVPPGGMQKDPSGIAPVFPADFAFGNVCSPLSGPDNTPDPHWQGLVTYLNSLGTAELERRWKKAEQILHEHGVAYDIFSEQDGKQRPWELDPIPFPVPADTWEFLEKGICQRMRLLSAIYADIYGSQKLIEKNHLPPELFFANPRFLRQCHGICNKEIPRFYFHSTDLCRFPDGGWRIFSDRTQTPSCAGYALENRIILSRILPRMFHACKVHRLAPFFKAFYRSLMEISGMQKREPSIVMLTSGPASPTYFEHVFLSRYLGFTLVESSDLTVRNDGVFLKTLGEMLPVDVILRRIEDVHCDPLVFGSTSAAGISGLVQAVRSGKVAVANPLGSGILETPGLIPFLPGLCRLILGEEPILQDLPTLWCGQETALNTVLSRMADADDPVIISSAFSDPRIPSVDTRSLSRDNMDRLMAQIKAAPYAFVGRDIPMPCTLPVWEKGRIQNRITSMRMFSTATTSLLQETGAGLWAAAEKNISVMPGALTRMADHGESFLINTGQGQGSKDTWCFSKEVVEYTSMMHKFTDGLDIHRGGDLTSRVADNMLWLGRYVERTEGMLRVIRSALIRLNSESPLDMIREFPFLLRVMTNLDISSHKLSQPGAFYNMRILESEIVDPIFSSQHPGSIRNALDSVRQVAASVRDRLSNDSWHILGRMEKQLKQFEPHRHNQASEAQELVNEMILTMSAFAGLALESMTRSMGWRFMDMGRRLERAGYMITLLKSLFSEKGKPRTDEMEVLLEVADSTITYHNRYRTTLLMAPIVDLLLLDELNPRAVGFQMAALSDHVEKLPRSTPATVWTREEKTVLDLTTQLRLADIHTLLEMTPEGEMPQLNQLLERLYKGIKDLGKQITQHYLSRIETEKQLRNAFEISAADVSADPGGKSNHYEI